MLKKNKKNLLRVLRWPQFNTMQLARILCQHFVSPMRVKRGLCLVVGVAMECVLGVSAVQAEAPPSTYEFNIPVMPVPMALKQLVAQTGHQLAFSYELVKPLNSSVLRGRYTVEEALNTLLKNTDLASELTERGVIVVMSPAAYSKNHKGNEMNTKRNILAMVVGGVLSGGVVGQDVVDGDEMGWLLEEIVVTASKRETSLQDTAMAISVLSGETIDKRGLVGMDDYLRSLPGVSMQDLGAGQGSVVIRGISGDPQQQAEFAGVYFGETPLSGFQTSSIVSNAGNIDIKLVDIAQIEVLRGPQGTLYGSDAMAGVVRTMPAAPNLNEVEGKLATRISETGKEGGTNTMVQGVLNIPVIEDTLAIRGVVYEFDNSGYIRNVPISQPRPGFSNTVNVFGGKATERDDIGADTYTGFRLAALWRPVEELDITLSYLEQDIEQDGHPEVSLNLDGDYVQRGYNTGVEGSSFPLLENEVDITSLVVNYDFGWGKLTSASSWVNYASYLEADFTHLATLLGFIDQPYGSHNETDTEAFTQEVRLASDLDGPLQFTAGLYYSDKSYTRNFKQFWTGDAAQDPGVILQRNTGGESLVQESVFGEVSYAFTEQLTATLGMRDYEYEKDGDTTYRFTNVVDDRTVATIVDTGQLYKANLSYTPNEDTLIYAQWSEGFHPGLGAAENPFCDAIGVSTSSGTGPDSTTNTELGFKSSFADNRVKFNAALYRIDWEDIPVLLAFGSNCFHLANAAEAKSEGIEIEIQAQLVENLRTDLSLSYGEAVFVGDSAISEDGGDLPGSSDFNASVGLQYDFLLLSHNGFARLDYTYISEYYSSVDASESDFTPTPSGGFGQFNVKAGMEFDQIAVDIFVNNLTNDDGLTWVENVNPLLGGESNAYRIRPRTIGVNLAYQF